MERRYATVNSTVILSWYLNFQKIEWRKGFTGQLNWKQQENAATHKLFDFNVTARGKKHETRKSSHFQFEIPESRPGSTVEVKLPKIHFNHSGQYQCQLAYNGRHAQNRKELVVMKGKRKRCESSDEKLQNSGSTHKSMGGSTFPSSHSPVLSLPLQSQPSLPDHSPEGLRRP